MGCTANKSSVSRYSYKVSELVSKKGQPISIKQNQLDNRYEMYQYEDETYQVDDKRVISKFRSPSDNEKNIQYWRHLLKGEYYKVLADGNDHSHGALYKLISHHRGLTIYFNKSSGKVIRIIESLGDYNAL